MHPAPPHRKLVKHYHEHGDLHELTFSCYGRQPLLTNDEWRRYLAQSIDDAGRQFAMELVAFVFMPEHVHLIVAPAATEPDISHFLASIKQPTSKLIKEQLKRSNSTLLERLTIRERPGKFCFRFWQEGPGYDRNLQRARTIEASTDYLHNNPVRRGLVSRAIDWKWSSASWYLLDPPRQQHPDLPLIFGPPLGSFDR